MDSNFLERAKALKTSTYLTVGTGLAVAAAVVGTFMFFGNTEGSLIKKLQPQFPKSTISSVSCDKNINGLCEVVIGKNVFYASKDARYVVVGSLLDLNKKIDVTDQRLKELAALSVATDKIEGGTVNTALASNNTPLATSAAAQIPSKIDVDLPISNAVVHNAGAPIKLKVFSDYNCHYCKAFFTELAAQKDIEVTEYPMGILGAESELKAKIVLCSADREAAAAAAYAGGPIKTSGSCDKAESAAEANRDFASKHGINGTPTIIRADGAVSSGFPSMQAIRAFAEGKV